MQIFPRGLWCQKFKLFEKNILTNAATIDKELSAETIKKDCLQENLGGERLIRNKVK